MPQVILGFFNTIGYIFIVFYLLLFLKIKTICNIQFIYRQIKRRRAVNLKLELENAVLKCTLWILFVIFVKCFFDF